MERYAIGIDVGGTKTWAALGSSEGRIVAEKREPTPRSAEGFEEMLEGMIGGLVEASGGGERFPRGIGVGIPGRVSPDGKRVAWVPNLPCLDGLALDASLGERWGVPVRLENDGRLALYGENWLGAAKGCEDVVMLTLGTGIGGAIMAGGRLCRGFRGTAGSMGWMSLDREDLGGGESGWLEREASGSAINRRAGLLSAGLDGYSLFEAAKGGNREAQALVKDLGDELGTAIASLVSVLDPEMVIVGGGVCAHLESLRPSMEAALRRHASPATRETPIKAAALLAAAGMMGALRLGLEQS